jgi:hypothetical protein
VVWIWLFADGLPDGAVCSCSISIGKCASTCIVSLQHGVGAVNGDGLGGSPLTHGGPQAELDDARCKWVSSCCLSCIILGNGSPSSGYKFWPEVNVFVGYIN